MPPLLALMWVGVGLVAPLEGEVSLSVSERRIEIAFASDLPTEGPQFLVSYLMALAAPYRPGDVDRLWDYPHGPDGTDAEWLALEVDGVPVSVLPSTGGRESVPLPSGRRVSGRIAARMPERYGALGRVDGNAMLAAVVPFVVIGPPGSPASRSLRVHWRVRYAPLGRAQWLEQPAEFSGDPALFAAAFARHGYVTLDGESRGPIVRPVEPRGAPPRWAFLGASADERLLEAYRWLSEALAQDGVASQRWVVAALRREPVVCAENFLIVSRELFRATPLPQIMNLHRFGLARRAIACALRHAWKLSAEDADALAAARVDALFRAEQTTLTAPRDLLRPLSFIPDIDSLIYAPQMPWADVYFLAIDEPRAGPPQPDEFFHGRGRGKLLFEKLWDRVGPEMTRALIDRARAEHTGLSVIASRELPEVWRAIVEDFGGRHPVYDVSFSVDDDTVIVTREGTGALAREPVTVAVRDADGEKRVARAEHFEATDPEHARAEVRFPGAALPIDRVEIDPDRRLVEYRLKPGEHPRFDNSTTHRLRLTLNRLSATYGTSDSEVVAGIDFGLRREYDLHHRFGFSADYDPRGVGYRLGYGYAFGPRVTPDYLAYQVGGSATFDYLVQGFVGALEPVYMVTLYAYLRHDDRPSYRTAMRGFGWQIYSALGLPWGRVPFGYAGASILKIIELADGHGLAGRLRVSTVIGEAPKQALFSLGGRNNARGFPQGEHAAAARITANLEYRHVLLRGFRASLFDLVYLDGIEGAVFADAVLLSNDRRKIFAFESAFFDVGYGIRFLFDQLGVNPGMMSIEVGIPLKRYDYSLPPVSVFIDFVQSFSSL